MMIGFSERYRSHFLNSEENNLTCSRTSDFVRLLLSFRFRKENLYIIILSEHRLKNKTRKRKITCFNPPFNINVATNVSKTFLTLIDKQFPKNKRLSKIFNRNTIKVRYSCLPNVKQTISDNNHRLLQIHRMKESNQESKLCNCRQKHSFLPNVKQTISDNNHRLLQIHRMKESNQESKLCNCRQKYSCPLDGKCLTKYDVYKATVTETTSNNQETYIGLTENEFKTRFNLHMSSSKLEYKRTSTTLSEHVWKFKKKKKKDNKSINFKITWEVVKK